MQLDVSKMEIRKFKFGEENSLINLWKEVFPNDPPHNEPSSVIKSKLEIDDLIFVVIENGELIGACMAGYDGHRGWLYSVAVSTRSRRKGVGSKLVKYTIKELSEIGCVKVNLQIRSTNEEVSSFYLSFGFSVEDRLSMGAFVGKNL